MPEYHSENETAPRRVVLAGLCTGQDEAYFERTMRELAMLAETAHMETAATLTQNAKVPSSATYLGSGKVEELKITLEETGADLVLFDQTLTPMQFRNLGKALGAEVMDRTGVILQIFSEQARTREARLQVEYAQLQYILPRLAGMWTHFGRQGGGSGSRSNRGVGETQIELDRRYIERRMSDLDRELKAISRERSTQRGKRTSSDLPRAALVGYTNAGKSTLMNRLLTVNTPVNEEKKVYEKDKLFATLDTTVRRITPKDRRPFLLSDTVGFISDLPTALVKAFRSTLEEVLFADLLIQVVDYSDPDYRTAMKVTEDTLREIGAGSIPMLVVFNKADIPASAGLLPFSLPAVRERGIYMSAKEGIGIPELLDAVSESLSASFKPFSVRLPYDKGGLLGQLRESADLSKIEYREDGIYLEGRCGRKDLVSLLPYLL